MDWPEPGIFRKSQLSLPTTAHLQHSRPCYLTGHALGAYWRTPDTQVVARKRVSGVSRNAPCLPSKQAHALNPLGAISTPPFFCCNGYGFTQNVSGNKKMVEKWWKLDLESHFCTHVWVQPPFGREMAQIQPPTHTADPIPFFVKCVLFYYPGPLSRRTMRFRTKFGWEWWAWLLGYHCYVNHLNVSLWSLEGLQFPLLVHADWKDCELNVCW